MDGRRGATFFFLPFLARNSSTDAGLGMSQGVLWFEFDIQLTVKGAAGPSSGRPSWSGRKGVVGAGVARAAVVFFFPRPARRERNVEWWWWGVKTGGGEGIVLCRLQMEMGLLACCLQLRFRRCLLAHAAASSCSRPFDAVIDVYDNTCFRCSDLANWLYVSRRWVILSQRLPAV